MSLLGLWSLIHVVFGIDITQHVVELLLNVERPMCIVLEFTIPCEMASITTDTTDNL